MILFHDVIYKLFPKDYVLKTVVARDDAYLLLPITLYGKS